MKVHLFGAVSSPGCANFALKRTADDFEELYGREAAEFLRNDFYVDDGLKSVPSVIQASNLIKKTKELCAKGGFNLHKFLSNKRKVIESVPTEQRAKGIKDFDLSKDLLPIERALGVQWCVQSDHLKFRVELKDRPLTRRGILSTVSSIYDPLGLIAPFLLQGKRILQAICKDGARWDDPVPDHLQEQWEKWREQLGALAELTVPRCYKPVSLGAVRAMELHHFSDASTVGYGQCSYLRMVDTEDNVHCALVMAKARVSPSKAMTIPRMELTAALLSVKISALLQKELRLGAVPETFWTDSEVVRGYVSNDSRRFHTFVANRVQAIRAHTTPRQWRRISTKENPADDASRGLSAQELINSQRWWTGPTLLWHPSIKEASSDEAPTLSETDPEVRKVCTLVTVTKTTFPDLPERLERFLDWHKTKTSVALCLRLQKGFKWKGNAAVEDKKTEHFTPVNVEELRHAEYEIIKAIQKKVFSKEIAFLSETAKPRQERERYTSLKKLSAIGRLDPFIDQDGLLRVGGRIRHADLPFNEKHPVILPKKGHITELVIRHHHAKTHHQGRYITHAGIRSAGFWIINGNSAVGYCISNCVNCQRQRGVTSCQKMANLPQDRLEEGPPFTYSAVDYFGSFYIKEGRRQLKRYGVLFTCMASRAIHLETVASLSTDSFLNAYRRFIGRRGPVRQLRSDRGSNFVGALSELKAALSEIDGEKVGRELARTPNHLLTQKSQVVLKPPGVFQRADLYCKKRWRRVQHLANEFWKRWRNSYMQLLQVRQKWLRPRRNLEVGDVVVLKEEDLPRICWKLARISRTYPGTDGLVRKVQIVLATDTLDDRGRQTKQAVHLERPIHKLVLLVPNNSNEDQGIPAKEP